MTRAVRGFAARSSEWFAVLVILAYTVPALALLLAAPQGASFTPTMDAVPFAVIGWTVLLPVVVLTVLRWWGAAGFTRRSTRRSLVRFLPVILLYNLLPLLTLMAPGTVRHDPAYIFLVAITVLAGGFGDEATFRGVVLQTLLPDGARRAVLVSSVLFGVAYLRVMALDIDPVHVVSQAANSVGMGIAFAALVVVTGTIWPLVLISAASQVVFYLTYLPNSRPDVTIVVIELLMGALAAAYGIWLLHRHQHRHGSSSSTAH
ncbi:MAG: CPBP family intramembrane glutamic endopeptidase [Brooklawnia sp.]